jgi:ATP-dependent DNA helicase RecG
LAEQDDFLSRMKVTTLKGVGPKSAERLARLGIYNVQDILFHLPLRYQDRTRITPVADLRPGDEVVIQGVVVRVEIRFGRRRSMLVHLLDNENLIMLRFFHFSAAQKNALKEGLTLRCFGEVRNGASCHELIHPEYRVVGENLQETTEETLTPVYPTTEGMHQISWRDLTSKALDQLQSGDQGLQEWLPAGVLKDQAMMMLADAITYLHRPPPDAAQHLLLEGRHPAQQRLAFEELVAHQLSMRQARQVLRQRLAPRFASDAPLSGRLLKNLPFEPTGAQQRVCKEIAEDMSHEAPMLRLVQGDVGSGKTVVAALAALQAIEAGYQVALMAPTELLAEQHLRNFEQWLQPLGVGVGWLTGRIKGKARQTVLRQMEEGSLSMLVGTQALFQDDVVFHALGLVIVDEQHRFGVHQRLALRDKGASGQQMPHQLIMTATPIPRSLAMTAYADLDLSIIDELPPGRTRVQTLVVSDARRDEVIERVQGACASGRQAYWVCTLIEESELLQCQAAEDVAEQLQQALPGLRVGLVHGRMPGRNKEEVMQAFKAGEVQLLVATTVIEVGVDVPNASLMIIENPERLGLSQLHQLRGRVGRGSVASHCVLLYHPPLGQQAIERLAILRESSDGFVIARKDLELRGPGEVLGVRQTGEMQFRIADILRDQPLLDSAREVADMILENYPVNVQPLVNRWLGKNTQYAGV